MTLAFALICHQRPPLHVPLPRSGVSKRWRLGDLLRSVYNAFGSNRMRHPHHQCPGRFISPRHHHRHPKRLHALLPFLFMPLPFSSCLFYLFVSTDSAYTPSRKNCLAMASCVRRVKQVFGPFWFGSAPPSMSIKNFTPCRESARWECPAFGVDVSFAVWNSRYGQMQVADAHVTFESAHRSRSLFLTNRRSPRREMHTVTLHLSSRAPRNW